MGNPLGPFRAAVETFTEGFVKAQKLSKAISHFLPKRAGAKSPSYSHSYSAQRARRPHASSAAVRHEHEPAVRSRQQWPKRHQGLKGQIPCPDRNGRPPAPESKPVSRRRKAAPSAEAEPLKKSACSVVCAHYSPLPVVGGERNCHVSVLTVPLCSAIKLKNTQNSPQYQGNFPPLTPLSPISHSLTCVVLNSLPSQRRVIPHGVQSASPAVTVHRSVVGTARVIRVVYEINKERLHASVLPQTAPFQRCVNVHCTGAECLSSAKGNAQSSCKARCGGSVPHRIQEWLLHSLFSGAKERWRTPPNLGPVAAESHAFKAPVQNDYAETYPLTYQTWLNRALLKRSFKMITLKQILSHIRLVYLCGFKGCLFSHSGSPPPQALPEICIQEESEPIHDLALRFMSSPSYVYEMHGCCSLSPLKQRARQLATNAGRYDQKCISRYFSKLYRFHGI